MSIVDDIFPIRRTMDEMVDAWDNTGFKNEQTTKER